MHTQFRVQRNDNVALVFTGVLLAEVSSHEPTGPRSQRWSETRIYRTLSGKYVAERVGRTVMRNEHDRRLVQVHDDPAMIRTALERPRDNGVMYLTDMDYEAIETAAAVDPALNVALEERI